MSMIFLTALLAWSPLTIGDEPVTPEVEVGLPWVLDIEAAKEMARKEGKDILINFTGSDWCGWCKKLEGEVFSLPAFHESAGKQYVYLYLDFPRSEEAKAKVVDEVLNGKSRDEMGVNGFPTIILADHQMRPYAKTGYQAGGPEKYLEHIVELRAKGDKIKSLLAAEDDAQQGEILPAAFDVMAEHGLLGFPDFGKYLTMAEKSDNSELVKKAASHRARKQLQTLLNTQEPDFPLLVKFLKDHPDMEGPEVLNALWFSHGWMAEQGDKDGAKLFLTRMLQSPEVKDNERGRKMIEDALQAIDHDATDGHDHDGDGKPDH
ncbi:MAG: thioredoxin family protein [Planctomycetota bacterium]|nr:thioredoxin family protein [Planctomycetota bacterium]